MHIHLQNLRSPSLLARILGAVLAVVLAIFGFFLMAGALALGLLLAAGAVVWALLRGRRPSIVNMRWKTTTGQTQRAQPRGGEVIDIDVREVDETPRR
jgi:hypothetical protein